MHIVHKEKLGVYTIKIVLDPEPLNPRIEFDCHLGKISCRHSRYHLGDKPYNMDIDELKEIIDSPDIISLPLYLYDHGGITMRCSSFGCPFDSGQVGYIYCSVADAEKEYSTKDRTFESWLDMVKSRLASEIEEYDHYLTGNCYGFIIEDQNGEEMESCYGFLGDQKYCLEEARSSATIFNNLMLRKQELAVL